MSSTYKQLRAGILFPGYFMAGQLFAPPNQRLTDLLYTSNAYATMFEVKLCENPGTTPFSALKPKATFEFVTINFHRAISVVEM
jgi:hypothetical protein